MKHLFRLFLFILFFNILVLPVSARQKDVIFAQVTDLHFSPTQDSIDNYKNLINSINRDKQIKFVVFTGDNIIKPNVDLLKFFLKMTRKIKVPVYIQVGNEECLRSAGLSKQVYMEHVNKNTLTYHKSFNYVFSRGNVVFILVDGTKEAIPSSGGYFKDDTLKWLDKKLTKYHKKNVIIMQHYPIYDIGENSLQNLYKSELYKEILDKHKNIIAIFAGHYHHNLENLVGDVLYITTDSAQAGKSMYRKVFLTPDGKKNIEVYSQIVKF